jgi:ring-1,2-phenylacetyl-CoA epoxidase subunit PaaC
MPGDAPLFEYLLRLGDNALILSQRLSAWCGHGPELEEDLAMANVALDLLGQGRFWLDCAGKAEGAGRDEDALAFMREQGEFRNVLLVEQPNGDFGQTLARQFYFDAWHVLLLDGLSASADAQVAGIAGKAVKEASYHLRRSAAWVVRLGDGTEESHARMQAAVDGLWMYTGELFERDAVEDEMARRGVGCDPSRLREPWLACVTETFREATLSVPAGTWMQSGGKRGVHTEGLGHLLAEMQHLQRAYPGLKW